MEKELEKKYGQKIESLDYRYTGKSLFSQGTWDFEKMKIKIGGKRGYILRGKWDFQQMRIELMDKKKNMIKDRWFNPFWSVWLQHLMSRPSCYKCPFTTSDRVADITLGDLWGVHLYCPELYGNELAFEDALKYQGPMRKPIAENISRCEFIADLKSNMDFRALNKKWANPPTIKLLFQKYIWGNRQKVWLWNLFNREKINEV